MTAARRASAQASSIDISGGLQLAAALAEPAFATAIERFTRDAMRRTHDASLVMGVASIIYFVCYGFWAYYAPSGAPMWTVAVNGACALLCAAAQVAVARRYRTRALHPIVTWLPGLSMFVLYVAVIVTGFAEGGFVSIARDSWMPLWAILSVFPIAFAMSAAVYAVASTTLVVGLALAFPLLHALGFAVGVADAVSIALIVVFACAGFGAQRAANALVVRSIDQARARACGGERRRGRVCACGSASVCERVRVCVCARERVHAMQVPRMCRQAFLTTRE